MTRDTAGSAARFLVAGGLNTIATGLVLSGLSLLLPFQIAYPIVFVAGIVLSTFLAGHFVFKSSFTINRVIAYVSTYLAIFGVGWFVLAGLQRMGSPPWANGLVVLITAPLGYVAGRLVFRPAQATEATLKPREFPIVEALISDRHGAFQVLSLVVLLEVLVFWGYFAGASIPRGDFLASYLTEAHAWWTSGGIIDPPEWMSYAWMGFPADSNIQNSSYYLPVGLAVAVFGSYTPYAAAVMTALQTGLGAVGAYVAVRRFTKSHGAGLLALVAWFFCPLIYSNAQHPDIVRGASLLPWLFLALSPRWGWGRWWSIPAASLIVWQFLVGAYPGQVVIAAYALVVWALAWLLIDRRRGWLIPAGIAGVAAMLMSLAKYGPVMAFGAVTQGAAQSLSFDLSSLATVFYPYNMDAMPNDPSMRPYFLVVPVLVLVGYAKLRSNAAPAIALTGFSALLTAMSLWADGLVSMLPGLQISRFRTNDIKTFLLFGIVVMAAYAFSAISSQQWGKSSIRRWWPALVLVSGILLVPSLGPLSAIDAVYVVVVLFLIVATWWLLLRLTKNANTAGRCWAAALILLAVISGTGFVYSVRLPWSNPRLVLEREYFGRTVDELMSTTPCPWTQSARPARSVPPENPARFADSWRALVGAFSCQDFIGGYLNVKGSPTRMQQADLLAGPQSRDLISFYAAPSAAVPLSADGKLVDLTEGCLVNGKCGSVRVDVTSYSRRGSATYRVISPDDVRLAFNESYYPGWTAEVCRVGESCQNAEISAGPGVSISVVVPAGNTDVRLSYASPARVTWRQTGAVGLVVALLGAGAPLVRPATGWLRRQVRRA